MNNAELEERNLTRGAQTRQGLGEPGEGAVVASAQPVSPAPQARQLPWEINARTASSQERCRQRTFGGGRGSDGASRF